jgi:hypothetical protein
MPIIFQRQKKKSIGEGNMFRNKKTKDKKLTDPHTRNHNLYESIWSQGEIAYGHARILSSHRILEKISKEKRN